MWTRALADADASCGGKAHGLARSLAAGLRVPDGFVIDDRAFRLATGEVATAPDDIGRTLDQLAHQIEYAELPGDLVDEVTDHARRLGGPFAVRSSATIEDGEAGAAAGVFSSRTAVPIEELWSAIRAVWLSALTPLAAAYARRRGGETSINVIVQRSIAGAPVVAYTRPPGQPEGNEIWIQHAAGLLRVPRNNHADGTIDAIGVAGADRPDGRSILIAAEHAIGAAHGADVELVVPPGPRTEAPLEDIRFEDAWIVQARPIVHPVPPTLSPPPPIVLAQLDDGRVWTWDVAHNPDPLSPAQAGLVERIERAGAAPWSSSVCAGYLYTAPIGDRSRPPRPATIEELAARVAEIEARLDAALAGRGSEASGAPLAEAIERFVAFFRIWATELGPLIAVSRGGRPAAVGDRPSAVEVTLFAAARGELDEAAVVEQLGVLAPAWDVAVPTFAEQPAILRDAIARAGGVMQLDHTNRAADLRTRRSAGLRTDSASATDLVAPIDADAIAIAAADLAERDDWWFARAQWLIRKAILDRAAALGIADDAFWLPLDELVAAEPIDPTDASRRASGARAAAMRAARWNMPLSIGNSPEPQTDKRSGQLESALDSSTRNPVGAATNPGVGAVAGSSELVLNGIGSGGRATGRVRRFNSLASAIVVGRGDVVVTRAITPALAVIVVGCAAIVSETGGVLDHGAAMARELGIPCVVGCRDAWSRLAEGMIVTIDGDQVTID